MDIEFLAYIHWLSVLIAGLAYFALGAIWYSKPLFAKRWIRLTRIDANDPNASKGFGAIMGSSLVLMIIACTGLSVLASKLHFQGLVSGIKLGALTGFCFCATSISVSYLYEKRPFGLHLINGGYTITGHIIAAGIICAMN